MKATDLFVIVLWKLTINTLRYVEWQNLHVSYIDSFKLNGNLSVIFLFFQQLIQYV